MKRLTAQVMIGGTVTESAANTFTEAIIQIPLSPVDRQGFVIQECYIMTQEPSSIAGVVTSLDARVTKTSQTGLINVNDPMMVSSKQKICNFSGASTDTNVFDLSIGPTSAGATEYISILATTNAFVQVAGLLNNTAKTVDVRLVGYFAQLTSDEYNALVLDELQ